MTRGATLEGVMAGFDEIDLYAEPDRMLAAARQLAGVAAKLGPAGVRHRTVELAPGAFGAAPHSAAAHQTWRAAATLLTSYLTTATSTVEAMSEGVYRSSQGYRSGDARVSEMYRQLLLQTEADGAAAGAGPAEADAALITPAGIPPAGTHPDAVHDWWQRLGDDARRTVLSTQPGLVGSLDGVPVEARDRANRAVLDSEIARQRQLAQHHEAILREYGGDLETVGAWADAEATLSRLEPVQARLRADSPTFLIGFSAADDGQVIVALGNPDEAGQVVTYVPGMGSDLGTVPAQIGRLEDIVARAPERTAAILWLGYEAPDVGPQVAYESYARAAAEPLHRFQEGLRTTHLGDLPSHNVLLAHSYGSTTYGITAAEHGISADSVYLIGSIGTNQESAHGFLGTDTGKVYATTHSWDVAHLPPALDYYGANPSGELFDAQPLPGAYDGVLDSHTAYLHRPDILDNIAALLARRRP